MSQRRQPYVTLKQFIEKLRSYPLEISIKYSTMEYYRVDFPTAKSQDFIRVEIDNDWNFLHLGSGDEITVAELIAKLEPLVEVHPDAAVSIDGHLFSGFTVIAKTPANRVLCWETTMNPHTETMTVDEFLQWINDQHIFQTSDIFGAAESKLEPKARFYLYQVGETWLSERQLHDLYPKLTDHGTWTKLFKLESRNCSAGVRQLFVCLIPEGTMQQHFGAKKNLIDSLLEEAADQKVENKPELKSVALTQKP